MKHEMNLQRAYFDFVKDGTKRVEMRLFDEKRRKIQIGDEIEFWAQGEGGREVLLARVAELSRYRDFGELVEDFGVGVLAETGMTKAELLADLGEFYSKEAQEKYGVVGIKFELIDH